MLAPKSPASTLTQSYVDIATSLSKRVGMATRSGSWQGSALDMPFGNASFDAAMILHVGMNLPDKLKLMSEAARRAQAGRYLRRLRCDASESGCAGLPCRGRRARRYPSSQRPMTIVLLPLLRVLGDCRAPTRSLRHRILRHCACPDGRRASGWQEACTRRRLIMGEDAATKIANLTAALEGGILAPSNCFFVSAERDLSWQTSATIFVGIKSPNPFWLASAPPTDKAYNVIRAFKAGWGGVVWKTLGEEGPPVVNVNGPRYGAIWAPTAACLASTTSS